MSSLKIPGGPTSHLSLTINYFLCLGSGCGAVGRAVASNTRGPGFESSHWQLLLNIYLLLTVCRKDENKEKEAENGPFFQKKKIGYIEVYPLSNTNLYNLKKRWVTFPRPKQYDTLRWRLCLGRLPFISITCTH